MPRSALLACAAVAFAAAVWTALSPQDAALSLLLVAVALVLSGFVWLEAGTGSAKEVALVAVLGGAAAAGRVLFAAVPGVQPVTVVAVAAGAALGARVGFAVGAVAALVSNFYLGQGVWTPWQMLAWGGCGVVGALAAGLIRNRWAFAALCFALGFAFSSAMDLWYWYSFWPHTWEALTSSSHEGLVQRLPRGRQRRLRGRHRPRAAPAAGAVRPPAESGGRMGVKLAVIASSALALAAATPADYVASRQQADGGFAEPGARSDSALTAWAVLGLKAADAHRTERSCTSVTRLSRTPPISLFASWRFVPWGRARALPHPASAAAAERRQDRLARQLDDLGRARPPERREASRSLPARRQRPSGGWSWAPNGAPDSNDTAAAIQALRWSGVRGRPIRRGLAFIRNHTARNGGVGSSPVESRTPSRRRGPCRPTSPPASSLPRLPSASSLLSGGRTAATATAGATRSHRRS